MRIVFNSFNNSSPATIFYKSGIGRLENVSIDDFNNYSQYDYAIFMGFDEDLNELVKAKHQNETYFPRGTFAPLDPPPNKSASSLQHR